MKGNKFIVHLSGVIAMVFWGLSFIWSTQVFNYLNPTTTIFFRLIISCIFLGSILFLKGLNEPRDKGLRVWQSIYCSFSKVKENLKLFALAALFEPFLYFIFESYGLLNSAPVVSSAIIATIPLFTPIAAFFFLNERLSYIQIIGAGLILGGAIYAELKQ